MSPKNKGISACEQAFERLLAGTPQIKAHIGIEKSKITAGIVSVEAGFDRGYLKKSRPLHRPLIIRIEASRLEHKQSNVGQRAKLSKAYKKITVLESKIQSMQSIVDRVLTQNLMFVERIRELEAELDNHLSSGKRKGTE